MFGHNYRSNGALNVNRFCCRRYNMPLVGAICDPLAGGFDIAPEIGIVGGVWQGKTLKSRPLLPRRDGLLIHAFTAYSLYLYLSQLIYIRGANTR